MTDSSLVGRAAIVTGGSRGIGRAIAKRLVDAGAAVVITGRNAKAVEEAAATIGEGCVGFAGHVGDSSAAERCVDLAIAEFGRLDVLVNNAGTNPAYGPAVEVGRGAFDKTIEVNLWAPLLWTQVAWRRWMSERGGSIINVSSLGAFVTDRDTSIYAASKAALVHLTRHLALELAPTVRVNAVAPGLVATRLASEVIDRAAPALLSAVPLGRIGEPADVARAVAFLAGDAASWITGTTLVVDGGMSLPTSLDQSLTTTHLDEDGGER